MLPGNQEARVKVMEAEIVPFQVAKVVVITASFQGEADQSVYM